MNKIDPLQAAAAFRQFATEHGTGDLRATSAIALMVAFYRALRAEGCNIDDDGDMLLFQWGVYDEPDGETFTYNITRQFIVSQPPLEDAEIYQLALTLHYAPTESMRTCGLGNRWCHAPGELAAFEAFIRDCPATTAAELGNPVRVSLTFDGV